MSLEFLHLSSLATGDFDGDNKEDIVYVEMAENNEQPIIVVLYQKNGFSLDNSF